MSFFMTPNVFERFQVSRILYSISLKLKYQYYSDLAKATPTKYCGIAHILHTSNYIILFMRTLLIKIPQSRNLDSEPWRARS